MRAKNMYALATRSYLPHASSRSMMKDCAKASTSADDMKIKPIWVT
jgi:hypothetical protein